MAWGLCPGYNQNRLKNNGVGPNQRRAVKVLAPHMTYHGKSGLCDSTVSCRIISFLTY